MKDNKLEITDSYIRFEGTSLYVMMEWEHPVMKKHAEIVCKNGGDILEIGFGMGISANYIQQQNINSHTIIEIHPEIAKNAREWAKNKKNVTIIEGDWFEMQNIISKNKYDGIFYDTHNDANFFKITDLVNKCLKNNGIFTFLSFLGKDLFNHGSKLKMEKIYVNPEPNDYFNDNELYVVWVEF